MLRPISKGMKRDAGKMPRAADLTGDRFGRLTARRFYRHRDGRRRWVCECECGGSVDVAVGDLRSGNTRSCGCLRSESIAAQSFKHGRSSLPEYAVWKAMVHRCADESNADYGGRGITVCDRWRVSFEAFYTDMGPRPFPEAQIDREDNDGNYEPDNCRWVTAKVNVNNRGRK